MGGFFLKFWPVFVPLALYALWQFLKRRYAHKKGEDKPGWLDGPWYWASLAALAIGIALFLWLGLGSEAKQGNYIPPHVENGVVVPGRVAP